MGEIFWGDLCHFILLIKKSHSAVKKWPATVEKDSGEGQRVFEFISYTKKSELVERSKLAACTHRSAKTFKASF